MNADCELVFGELKFRSIWISDIYLGTRHSQVRRLLDFLRATDCRYLYIFGDLFDGWELKAKWFWREEQNVLIQKLLRKSRKQSRVIHLTGNHDEFVEPFLGLRFGNVTLEDYASQILRWHGAHPHVPLHCFCDKPGAPPEDRRDATLTFHRLHGEEFLRTMAGSRAVVCTAGFQSVSEAAYLGKPVLAIPVENHVEQQINALDISHARLGSDATWMHC